MNRIKYSDSCALFLTTCEQDDLGVRACQRVNEASNGTTATVFYLNSAIDWPFLALHELMENHSEYQLKDEKGDPMIIVGQLAFNHR